MKTKLMTGTVVLAGAIFLAGGLPAHAGEAAKVKTLQEAAAALQATHPDLAKGLTDFANEEAMEKTEAKAAWKKGEKREKGEKWKKGKKDSAAWKAKHEARLKLLRDSSAALQASNPDLAKALKDMTAKKHHNKKKRMHTGKKK